MRRLAYGAAEILGINRASGYLLRRRPLVICYHGVSSGDPNVPDPDGIHVPRARFVEQIEALLRRFQPISLVQLDRWARAGESLPSKAMLVTFDDGYRNVMANALPFLADRGVPSALFVVPGQIERGEGLWISRLELKYRDIDRLREMKRAYKQMSTREREHVLAREDLPEVPPHSDHALMSWTELAEVVKHSDFTLGTHGLTHQQLTTCDDERLNDELSASRNLLEERTGAVARAVAYPNGDWSSTVISAAQRAGYRTGFSTDGYRAARPLDPLAIPRIMVGRGDTSAILLSRVAGWQDAIKRRQARARRV